MIWCTLIISCIPPVLLEWFCFNHSFEESACLSPPASRCFKYCPGTTCGTVVPHSAKPPVSSKTSVAFQHSWRTNPWQSQCLFRHAPQCQSILECGDVRLIHLQLFIDRFIHPNDHGHGTWGIRTTTKSLQLVSGLPDGHVQATNLHRACPAEGTFIVLEMQPVRWWNSRLICGEVN